MKAIYIKPKSTVYNIGLKAGVLQSASDITIGGDESQKFDGSDESGNRGREDNGLGNNHNIWSEEW